MSQVSVATVSPLSPGALAVSARTRQECGLFARIPAVPMLFSAAILALTTMPRISKNPTLVLTFVGIAGVVVLGSVVLWTARAARGLAFPTEFVPIKSHYVQALVQLCILLYWGHFTREVYGQWSLVLGQLLFVYCLEGLITWSRGRTWRLGFGPMPIVFSTNLLLWFRDDWFYYQFLMVALGALGKQFVTWERDGRRTHIFNPSAFGQSLIALVLIYTGTTYQLTWGREIATTFDAPHILILIFFLGLVVQGLFRVTLMTVAAAATLCVTNIVYFRVTGTYFFVNINIAAPIFLGLHLLVTDPATSPKSYLGQVWFGVLYGLGYCFLFWLFDEKGIPLFWDKLLPVPILNLCVPLIDRVMRSGIIGRINNAWERAASPVVLNFAHMTCWAGLFATMYFTGFIETPHPGNSIPFWKQAIRDGKYRAGHSLVMAAGSQAENNGSGAAYNELGMICMEGKIIPENRAAAAKHFTTACELGNINGCANVAIQFLFRNERRSDDSVAAALDFLERDCVETPDWGTCFLIGSAYETGRGRPKDPQRAIAFYEQCGPENIYAAKGLARIALAAQAPGYDLTRVAATLERAAEQGDGESCWYLAYMRQSGNGVSQDTRQSRALLQKACELGVDKACAAREQPALPAFSKPRMTVPGWSTAFPVP